MKQSPILSRMIEKSAAYRHIGSSLYSLRYRLHSWLSPEAAPSKSRCAAAPPDEDFRQLSFTFAVIALSARIACADGTLTRRKYIAFREAFPLKGHLCSKIRSLFTLACDNPTPPEHYVAQIRTLFPERYELFVSMVERLCAIAAADGPVARPAERLLAAIAHGFALTPAEYTAILARHGHASQAHNVLGLPRKTGELLLKTRYRELMRRYHPDRFTGEELSPDIALLLQLKTSEINEAYRRLREKAA